jgi:hypothetical protein
METGKQLKIRFSCGLIGATHSIFVTPIRASQYKKGVLTPLMKPTFLHEYQQLTIPI